MPRITPYTGDDDRKCRECGLRTVPRIMYTDDQCRCCYCTSCAAGLGLMDSADVDHEMYERWDEIVLKLEEAGASMQGCPPFVSNIPRGMDWS